MYIIIEQSINTKHDKHKKQLKFKYSSKKYLKKFNLIRKRNRKRKCSNKIQRKEEKNEDQQPVEKMV